ncbi:MAG: OmpA family protein [Polyangiaceae bacterium]
MPLATALNSQWDKKAAPDASIDTSGLHISAEIARACGLPKTEVAPSFNYDSSSIADEDRLLLGALARCLSEGALKGRGLALIGRADTRGEGEYNMGLGEARADSVRRFLHDMGVQPERVSATSRGELDATGTDDATFALDRRVDVDLAGTN